MAGKEPENRRALGYPSVGKQYFMQAGRIIRLIFTFYRGFILVSFFITAICVELFWKYGLSIYATLFWFKLSTLGVIYYFVNTNKAREYYYFRNLGISKALLWTSTLIFDFICFILFILLSYKFR
jgi:hypothetical protein